MPLLFAPQLLARLLEDGDGFVAVRVGQVDAVKRLPSARPLRPLAAQAQGQRRWLSTRGGGAGRLHTIHQQARMRVHGLKLLDVCEQFRVRGLRESCGANEEPEEGNDLKGLHFLMASTLQR